MSASEAVVGSGLLLGKTAGRRRRSDFGSVRISERDKQLLLLIGEQYAITITQLARLIGRTERTARWLRDRWRKARWVESRQLEAGGPAFIWLTDRGSRAIGSPYRRWEPKPALAAHIAAVTDTRLLLEQQLRLGDWECERALAKSYGWRSDTRLHLPDGVLATGEGRIAIEVELSLKSRARLETIVDDLAERYERVWYFAASRLVPTLRELAAAARWQNVHVHHQPPLLDELRLAA